MISWCDYGLESGEQEGKNVFVKLEYEAAGRIAIHDNRLVLENHWVSIETFQASFNIKN